MAGLLDALGRFWRALTPEARELEPVVSVLDDARTEFAWGAGRAGAVAVTRLA